jgi:DNA-binding PadR family transcriptional regulator
MNKDKQRLANPLALAVLVLLFERPMHPYEMAGTLKERKKEESIKLNFGSLYTVIEQLLKKQFISARETVREGRRPEKTIFQLTPSGELELMSWMRELVSEPVKEYPRFEAALSLIPVLAPEEVAQLLELRIGLLNRKLQEIDDSARVCREMKLPRLFSLENEFHRAMTETERHFTKGLLADINRNAGGLASEWGKMRNFLLASKLGATSKKSNVEKNKLKK